MKSEQLSFGKFARARVDATPFKCGTPGNSLLQRHRFVFPGLGGLRALLYTVLLVLLAAGPTFASGQTLSNIHDFGGSVQSNGLPVSDGHFPETTPILDSQGDLFGTAVEGGAHNQGMIWEVTATGTYIDLHDFGGIAKNASGNRVPDGVNPSGQISLDPAGNLYGTAQLGGVYGGGVFWELSTTGAYTDVHDFGGTVDDLNDNLAPDGIQPIGGASYNPYSGVVFGTAYRGGPNGLGVLWMYSPLYTDDFIGGYILDHAFAGPDGANPAGGLSADVLGVYGTTFYGGLNNAGTIFRFTGQFFVLHSFGGPVPQNAEGRSGLDGSYPMGTVLEDPDGNIFGTTTAGGGFAGSDEDGDGDSDGGMLWRMTTSGTYSDIHDFAGLTTNTSGAKIVDGSDPMGDIAMNANGVLFGAASDGGAGGNGMVWEFLPSGVYHSYFNVFGNADTGPIGQYDMSGSEPTGVVLDSAGNLYGAASIDGPYGLGTVWTVSTSTFKSMQASPNPVTGGIATTGIITLAGPAPVGGVTFVLSTDSSLVVPLSTATVPEGASSVSFPVQTKAVSTNTTVHLTAQRGSTSWSTALTIEPAKTSSFTISPASVVGGSTSMGTVTLNAPAPPSGTKVSLTASNSSASVPSSITVAPGITSATFVIKSSPVSMNTAVQVQATLGTVVRSAALTVDAPGLIAITLSTSSVAGGTSLQGTVILNGPAPSSGSTISLSVNSNASSVPATVLVPPGQSSVTFPVATYPVVSNSTVTVTGRYLASSAKQAFVVQAPTISSLTVSPSVVIGGFSSVGTVTLSSPAPSAGIWVTITSNYGGATAPATLVVPQGLTTGKFTIKTAAAFSVQDATITVKYQNSSANAPLTINPA